MCSQLLDVKGRIMSKGKLDNYKCDGQISVFDYIETLPCAFSGHTCNKKELWKVADTLDDLMCPHVCCRQCNTVCCGVRCNGSNEPERLTPAEEYYKETGKKNVLARFSREAAWVVEK